MTESTTMPDRVVVPKPPSRPSRTKLGRAFQVLGRGVATVWIVR